MPYLLDTSVLIGLRDGAASILARVGDLAEPALMSVVSRVELEGGVYRHPADAAIRRLRLDALLAAIPVLTFDDGCAEAYGQIVAQAGYSRRKLVDRMIAAQALTHRATLVTLNPDDFSDVPGLQVHDWSEPHPAATSSPPPTAPA